jgi:hypothetical protein
MNKNLKDQDVLLVNEKDSNKLSVATMDKDGKVKQAKPDGENPDLLKIDKYGNILQNFFENFNRQVKEPTRFEFFRVPAERFNDVAQKLQEAFKKPDTLHNREFMDLHRIDPEVFLKRRQGLSPSPAEISKKKHIIDPDSVQWDKLEKNFGIKRETLEKTGVSNDGTANLDRLLNYGKTDLLTVSIKVDETSVRTDARFSLRKQEDGSFVPAIHPIRHKPDLDNPYFGIKFTDEDKQNLSNTGNLGRVIEAEFRYGEKTPVLLSVDKQTNELVSCRTDRVYVPDKIKGVELNDQQKKELSEGKAVHIDNMTSKNGKEFSASLQFNADKRSLEFLFDNDKKQSQSQSQNQEQDNGQKDIQKTFRKRELTEDQRDSLREGKTVKVDGLVDKKGKGYSGYITLNKETGKMDFLFPNQYILAKEKGLVIPDNNSKIQVAVNSEGKTNEATKKVKEPLKTGQTKPTEKQADKQKKEEKKEEKETVKKSKGVKM